MPATADAETTFFATGFGVRMVYPRKESFLPANKAEALRPAGKKILTMRS